MHVICVIFKADCVFGRGCTLMVTMFISNKNFHLFSVGTRLKSTYEFKKNYGYQ